MNGRKDLQLGDTGKTVFELQLRLKNLGFPVSEDESNNKKFGKNTELQIKNFQKKRGLNESGILDKTTSAIIIEASYSLGDRQIYLQSPMLRGDDVADLQRELGILGFDSGRIDGTFGPKTTSALIDFQKNFGLISDGIAGHEIFRNLQNIAKRQTPETQISQIRELETLRGKKAELDNRRLVIGHFGNCEILTNTTARILRKKGAKVIDLNHPDEETQARAANGFDAEMYLGFQIENDSYSTVNYFETKEFKSEGGLRLASYCEKAISETLGVKAKRNGMQLPILRSTKMAAVVCRMAPANLIISHTNELGNALAEEVTKWIENPSIFAKY